MPMIVGGFLLSFVCGYVASQFSSTSLKGDLGGGKSALQECIDACYLSSVGGSSSKAPVYCCAIENDSCIAAPDSNPESDACDQNRTDYTTDSCDGNCGGQSASSM